VTLELAHCRSCHAPIIWTVTANGKRMPVDADPVGTPRGFRVDESDQDDTPVATFTAAPAIGEKLYQSHFSTCPNADQHRR